MRCQFWISLLLCLTLPVCSCTRAPEGESAPPPAASEPGPGFGQLPPVPAPAPEPETNPEPTPALEPEPVPEPVPAPEPVYTKLQVLMYHNLWEGADAGKDVDSWTIGPQRFREDLQWLRDHGYTTVLPSEVIRGDPLPKRAVLLTFDDGYKSVYTQVFPILREFGDKAVVSLITHWIEEGDPGYLTWEECREMADSGLVEFGSHTHDAHEEGIRRREGECREDYEARVLSDIQRSVDLIQEHLGAAPQFFAYPKGLTDKWALDYLLSRFQMTAVSRNGWNDVSDWKGLYGLYRHNVSVEEPPSFHLPD